MRLLNILVNKFRKTTETNIYQNDHTQTPEIFILIREHKNEEAKKHLKHNPSEIFLKGWMDDTPLHIASLSGNFEMVKHLLNKGANVNSERSGIYTTPLCWADNYEIAKYLLEKGATMNDRELFCATQENKSEIVDLLLNNGAKINNYEPEYLQCKSIECIKIYLKHKIELNGCDENKSNLLHKLAWLDLPEVFDFAYKNGSQWQKDSSNRTPYYLAKQGNCKNILNHFEKYYSEIISNKVTSLSTENYHYNRIFFLKENPIKLSTFIVLTKNSNLVKYSKYGNEIIVNKIINIDLPTIRNFTFDYKGNIVIPTGDNKLLIIEEESFNHTKTITLPENLVLDQITYIQSRNLYIGSSQNWEIILLSENFEIISRTEAQDGTLSPKINHNNLIAFNSYDQETYFNLYHLKENLSVQFIHCFFKEWNNTSSGFAFNGNEFAVSFPNELEYYLFKDDTITKIWEMDISKYKSRHQLSYLAFKDEKVILIGIGKTILFIDKQEKKILQEIQLGLVSEIKDLYVDESKENLIIYTDNELKLIQL
ncbi:ankyrin repeat protein [Flavobacterium chryseum]|uniref:ankyrin repeat domain-containing protein n=1 Tax=Flavobacterium sp. P3160 TaxID=2512113 RepID=UPI0010602472|nr:ankyrin repeat domain-containing protein [Flavobacterium sp. P3160]TDO72727.1 ankyrin repeat protein [Flavobacterium sp. P3160]